MKRDSFLSLSLVAVLLLGAGCGQETGKGRAAAAAEQVQTVKALQTKRQEYEARLKAMSVAQLAQEMTSDSRKGREAFNSGAYRETISRGRAAGEELRRLLVADDRNSILGLLALRRVNADEYKAMAPAFRVNVLIDALKNATYFNAWGIPHVYWEDAAKAIIEESNAAQAPLVALLDDKRPAPLFGSEGAAINQQYHYRVCDYAWALLNEIAHQKVEIPADVATRDRLIEQRARAR
jgi:hypothetical protein